MKNKKRIVPWIVGIIVILFIMLGFTDFGEVLKARSLKLNYEKIYLRNIDVNESIFSEISLSKDNYKKILSNFKKKSFCSESIAKTFDTLDNDNTNRPYYYNEKTMKSEPLDAKEDVYIIESYCAGCFIEGKQNYQGDGKNHSHKNPSYISIYILYTKNKHDKFTGNIFKDKDIIDYDNNSLTYEFEDHTEESIEFIDRMIYKASIPRKYIEGEQNGVRYICKFRSDIRNLDTLDEANYLDLNSSVGIQTDNVLTYVTLSEEGTDTNKIEKITEILVKELKKSGV